MNSFKRHIAGFAVLLVCVTLFAGCTEEAEPEASESANQETTHGTVDPVTKQHVEQALAAFAMEAGAMADLDQDAVFALLKKYVQENPQIYGAAFAFAPQGEEGGKSAPYVFRHGETLVEKDLIDSYDYTAPEQQWYIVPVETKAPVWSAPYFDEGGGDVWMITYAIPVYTTDEASQLVGVVTSDVVVPKS